MLPVRRWARGSLAITSSVKDLRPSAQAVKILVIEDNLADSRLIQEILSESRLASFHITCVRRLSDAATALATATPDAALIDLGLPDAVGFEAVQTMRSLAPTLPLVVATGNDDQAVGVAALSFGADDFVCKTEMEIGVIDRALWYAIERRRVYRHVEQNQRLASIGRMVSGLAHEINNPSSYLIGNLELLREHLVERPDDPDPLEQSEIAEMLDDCLEGVRRIRSLVRELQAFARIDSEALEDVDVNAAARSACEVVRKSLRLREPIALDLGELPPIRADRAKLCQALLNVVSNAADAVTASATGEGTVTVRTKHIGGEIVVDVIDTGDGISETEYDRIFEPFYTTKSGAGVGLGLSIAAEVVRRHGGRIAVTSQLGQGSKFSVCLPIRR